MYKYWSVSGAKPDCIMLFLRYSRAKTEKDTSSVGIIVSKFWIPGVWFWGPKFWKSLCYWSFSGWVFIVSCSGQTSRRPRILCEHWAIHCFNGLRHVETANPQRPPGTPAKSIEMGCQGDGWWGALPHWWTARFMKIEQNLLNWYDNQCVAHQPW